MNILLAKAKAIKLMTEHGLIAKGWKFEFNKQTTSFGLCSYGKKEIQLSIPLTQASKEEKVIDTILHEIAHSLVGRLAGHDYTWKRIAKSIGCSAQVCGDIKQEFESHESLKKFEDIVKEKKANYKYKLVCPSCKTETPKRSIPKRGSSCIKCCPTHYNPKFKLELKNNI